MLKRLLTTVLAGCLLLSAASCGDQQQTSSSAVSEGENQMNNSNQEEQAKEFRLEDFGGAADGITDNMDAALKLVQKLRFTVGKKRLVLNEGTYLFTPDSYAYAISISGLSDVEIIGEGAEKTQILMGNPNAGFITASGCHDISIGGFSIDFTILPFTQGEIVAVDPIKYTYDLKIDEGFGLPTEPWYTETAAGRTDVYRTSHIMDGKTGLFKNNTVSNVGVSEKVEDLGGRVYRFSTSRTGFVAGIGREAWKEGQIEVGDRMVVVARMGAPHLMSYSDCENTIFENMNIYCAAGFALINTNTSGTAVARNINVRRKDGRMVTMCADAINFTACRAKPVVENCFIEANCDDSISGGSYAPSITYAEAPNKIFVQKLSFFKFQEGDRVAVFDQKKGRIRGETTIETVEIASREDLGDGFMLTLTEPVEGIYFCDDHRLTDLLMTPDAISSGMVIRNCTVAVKAGRGIFIHGQDVTIENCTFKDVGGQAIYLANEAPNNANGYVKNVIIRNNTFDNTCYMKKIFDLWGAIHVGTLRQFYLDRGDTDMYVSAEESISTNVEISNNTLTDCGATFLYLSAVRDGVISGNVMKNSADAYTVTTDATVVLDNCQDMVVKKNVVDDSRAGLSCYVRLRGSTSMEEVTFSENTFQGTAGKEIGD